MRSQAFPLVLLTACAAPAGDTEADRAELLRMHQLARTAHLEKRADQMVASFDDSIRFVADGEVTVTSPAENQARFQAYFDRSTFQAWDDIAPPLLRISPDGRMAYKLVRKRVQLTSPDSAGRPVAEHVVYAWIEVYEKPHDRWILKAVASTERPGP
ncbi:MAG TPA: hypothetical protein VH680_17335 [Gemmatimonadales bacterium]|jgi:hypothetical protein